MEQQNRFLGNDSTNLIDSEILIDSRNNGTASQEEEELSTREVLQRLHDAWINEKFAPELLENQIEVVDCLLGQIAHIEEKIAAEKLQNVNNSKNKFAASVYKMEIGRIRFVISSYLRIRLEKIQRFIFHQLEHEEKANEDGADSNSHSLYSKMTEQELKFAKTYRSDISEVFKKLALDYMPGAFKDFEPISSANDSINTSSLSSRNRKPDPPVPRPNMNSTVFVKAVEDVSGVVIEDEAGRGRDEDYDMAAGSQHILNYKSVANLIRNGRVKLM